MRRWLTTLTTCVVMAACSSSAGPESGGTGATTPEGSPQSPRPVTSTNAVVGEPGLTCWTAPPDSGDVGPVTFEDVTETVGLLAPLSGMHGHTAVWGDVDGDDAPDLFVGSFADREPDTYRLRGADGPAPDRLLIQTSAGFVADDAFPEMRTRTSGGVAADLDLDGDLDLVLSRNFRQEIAAESPTIVMRNDDSNMVPVVDSGLPEQIGARSVAVLDYNSDGLPDLFMAEDRWSGGSSVLLENLGGLRFRLSNAEAGIPRDVHGLGVAAADFNRDGADDLFVAGSNRLFVAVGGGMFVETGSDTFRWPVFGDEDDVAGVSVADINRDGWLDMAVGHHYNSTIDFGERVPVRIYLNRGIDASGMPRFEDVTERTGLPGLSTKAPHVELNDFDNDGWPDLLTSASAGEGALPALFMGEGLDGDIPQFGIPDGLGDAQYWVASPSADYDRDGRLDVFLLEWEPALPSLLLHNATRSGNWLEVSVGPESGSGIGWMVEVLDEGELLGARELTVTQGYSAGVSAIAHFGLGSVEQVTVRLKPPGGQEPIDLLDIEANQHLRYPAGCGS